jgi:hypothetical protein
MEETDSLTDPMLLGEIMEAREELDEARTEDEVESLRTANGGMSQQRHSASGAGLT